MVFTQYCKFGYKITTKIWNTQGFLQENANLFKFYTLKAALIPPFVVQSRDHLATITDIYVPSFSYVLFLAVFRGFLSSVPPWRIALTWQFEREEPRGAMLRPRL